MSSGGGSGARNETVDALRGLAAVSVCLFHFTKGTSHFADVSLLRGLGGYGWLGVEVFFVISGFIVPYAMAKSSYTLAQWPRFMAKRLIRLEPPYLVSIVVVIALLFASSITPGFKGPSIDLSFAQIASHLGYLTAIFGLPWLNPVYWSLAIEFQYYVLIGVALPALLAGTQLIRLAIVAVLTVVPVVMPIEGIWLITAFLPIFSAGLLTFLLSQNLICARLYWIALCALAAFLLIRFGKPTALATVVPAVMIALVRLPRIPSIAWLGAISYSLYLLHVPIGGRVINLATRFPASAVAEIVAVALAFAASLLAAYVLYILVERPSQEIAAGISYIRRRREAVPSVSHRLGQSDLDAHTLIPEEGGQQRRAR